MFLAQTVPSTGAADAADTIDSTMFLGDDLLPWMLVAFGGAMAVGTALALFRPSVDADGEPRERPPMVRSLAFIVVGAVCAIWGLASIFG